MMGKLWHLDDLVDEVIKDRAYFETSGGGITISGGEPTMQAGFVSEFLKILRGKGLHTALDTCGQCSRDMLEQTLPYAAMVLFDIKLIDPDAHKKFTVTITQESSITYCMWRIISGPMFIRRKCGSELPLYRELRQRMRI